VGGHRYVLIAAPRTLHTISDKRRYVVRVVSPCTTQRIPFNVLLYTYTLWGGLLLQQVRRGACGLPRNRRLRSRVSLLPAALRYVMSFRAAAGGGRPAGRHPLALNSWWRPWRHGGAGRCETPPPSVIHNPLIPHMLTRRDTRVTVPSSNTAGPAVRHTPNVDVAVTSSVCFGFAAPPLSVLVNTII